MKSRRSWPMAACWARRGAAASEERMGVAGGRALRATDGPAPGEGTGNAAKTADDHDREHLEPDEHHPEPATGDLRPQYARADRERAHHGPGDGEVAVDVD